MRTVIVKREYKSLLAFLIFISLFLIIRQNFANNIEVLYNKWTSIQFTNQSLPWVELEKLVSPYMLKIRDIERNFGFLIIFFSILIFSLALIPLMEYCFSLFVYVFLFNTFDKIKFNKVNIK
jgi:hypothetical protein